MVLELIMKRSLLESFIFAVSVYLIFLGVYVIQEILNPLELGVQDETVTYWISTSSLISILITNFFLCMILYLIVKGIIHFFRNRRK